MAKIVQILTRPSDDYSKQVADAQVRDLDAVIQKLNTTYQQELKDEVEAQNFFLN
jgi:hypothetical protein